jgi:hypothetical protein
MFFSPKIAETFVAIELLEPLVMDFYSDSLTDAM